MPTISAGGSRSDTLSMVLDQIKVIEDRLARVLDPDLLARKGPRYRDLRHGRVDVLRAWHAHESAVKNEREDSRAVVASLVTLAAVTMKLAIDEAVSARSEVFDLGALDDFED